MDRDVDGWKLNGGTGETMSIRMVTAVCASLLITGCAVVDGTHALLFGYEYNAVYCNTSTQNLHQVTCVDEPGPLPCGELVKGGVASSECRFPLPDHVTISWTDDSGKSHQQLLQIRRLVTRPEVFSGNIVFQFTDGDPLKAVVVQDLGDVFKMADAAR